MPFFVLKRLNKGIYPILNLKRIQGGFFMSDIVKVTVEGIQSIDVKKGTTVLEVLKSGKKPGDPLVAIVNGEVTELKQRIEQDATVVPLNIINRIAYATYARSVNYLFILAVKETLNCVDVAVDHAINNEIYGELKCSTEITPEDIEKVKAKMEEMIKEDSPIEKIKVPKSEAVKIFESYGMEDKLRLLKYAPEGMISLYKCRGVYDYFYGPMVPSLGYLEVFDLKHMPSGFLIMLPNKKEIDKIPEFKELPKLRSVYRETKEWAKILDIFNVGSINDKIVSGEIKDVILVGEGLHEKKISRIADHIYENREKQKIVLIAGPSSSGKTTFSKRLSIQLKVLGLKPYNISADDYFVGRDQTPVDENGEFDFESIEAVDVELLNKDLLEIIGGKEVELPRFNFLTGEREYRGDNYKMEDESIIIIEGIHSLNEKMTHSVPKENKYKIYVSALTQLNLDNHNSLYVSDVRTLRRMIRDNRSRGSDAENTLLMWPSVRAGEEKNIFPYQEEADVMFNSTIVYEVSVLKKYAEPLLEAIPLESPAYTDASRMLRLLRFFQVLDESLIPDNSIIREFIGGSCFE